MHMWQKGAGKQLQSLQLLPATGHDCCYMDAADGLLVVWDVAQHALRCASAVSLTCLVSLA